MAMDREQAKVICNTHPKMCREIMRCEVGSTSHGVNLAGADDFDMMAIAVERPETALGTSQFEHHIYRTAEVREGKKGVPSQPGDVDLTVYSLRKFARLAAQGNPSVLLVLYAPVMKMDTWGQSLRQHHGLFASKNVIRRFLGYMQAQKERLKGERGQMRITRAELIQQHGYDTKYAMHVLRLGYQGLGYLDEGIIECPIRGPFRNFLLGVRRGQQSLETVLYLAEQMETELKAGLDSSELPDEPDYARIDKYVAHIYRDVWTHEAL